MHVEEEVTVLQEVVVSAERNNKNVVSNQVVTKLNIKEIQAIPVIFGEKDILKYGFNIRKTFLVLILTLNTFMSFVNR